MWCHQNHWVFTFKIENSNAACWEFLSKAIHFLAQNAGHTFTRLCSGNGDHISWHNAIHDVVFSAAQSAALAPTLGLLASSLSWPADILLPNWKWGHLAALDVHVISPLQQQTLNKASFTPGHALQVGLNRKLASFISLPLVTWQDC